MTLHRVHIHDYFIMALIKHATFKMKNSSMPCVVLANHCPILGHTTAQLRDKATNLIMILLYFNMDFNMSVHMNLITIALYQSATTFLYFQPVGISKT